jgi:hypothetical protein
MTNGNKDRDREYIVHLIRSCSMLPFLISLGGIISGSASNWFISAWALTGATLLVFASLLKEYWGIE